MTSPTQFHVFLSAVSSEFQQERVQLENWLERKGLHVSSQEKFNQGGSTLWEKLHDEVACCRAVICVMGAEPGWPSSGELPNGAPERSWTQWEFWLAWGEAPWSPPRRDKVFVFFPADLNQRMEKAREAASEAWDCTKLHALDLQQGHIERVKEINKHYGTFTDADDLIKQCLVLDLPTIPRGKPSNLKYATLGSLFKGREEKLEEVHCRLTAGASPAARRGARQAIHGLGGVGKTRFVVEYALRYAEEYQALLFVSADTREMLDHNFATLCGPLILDLSEQNAKEETARYHAVIRWLQTHQKWLLILDNVDTAEAAATVEELLGGLLGGTVLITSRLADWSNEIQTFELDELTESAAVEFLLERTQNRRRRLSTDANDAQALAYELGGLALALEQAGAFIAQKRSSLADYLARWRQHDQAVRQWHDERLTKYSRAVVTTWDTTVDQLSTEGLALLRQLSWMAPEPIPRSILPDSPAQDALAELASFSMANFEEDGGRFKIHRLVQGVTRERQSDEERNQSLHSMLKIFSMAGCGDPLDVRSWPLWDPLLPHLSAVTTYADQYGIVNPTARLMNELGLLFYAKARYGKAELLLRRALAIDEANYGSDHPEVASRLSNLAPLLQATNRLAEAVPLMKRALAIDEASYGPDHPTVAIRLNNLAQLFQATNRLTEAEPLMKRALAIDEASYGPDHPEVGIRLNNLALLLQATNRLAEAEPLMKRVLAIDEANYGPDHPTVAADLGNLASLLQATNRLEEAEPLMKRALAIDELSYGPDHTRVAADLNNLAVLFQATNRLSEAEPLLKRALGIDEASYGSDHPTVARRLNNLALLLLDTNRLTEAEPLMKRTLTIDEASYGPDHPNVATDLNNLALLQKATNRLAEAEPLLKRALGIDEASYGPDHPNVARDLNNLAQLLHATNRLTEAELLMKRALAIDETSYGPDHPTVAIRLNNLGALLQATNRLAEVEPLVKRALAIDEASYGPDHPNVARDLNNLAQLLYAANRLAEAEQLMRRVLLIFLTFTRSTEHHHPHLKQAYANYRILLQAMDLGEREVIQRLLSLGAAAGFDTRTYQSLLAEL